MPVNTMHPTYEEHLKTWKKCRDVCQGGEDKIKKEATTYLPALSSQKNANLDPGSTYAAYKNRAMFYPAAERTVAGLLGAVFRKKPTVTPETIEMASVGKNQEKLFILSIQVLSEVLYTGRVGLLVDAGSDETVQEKPYVVLYKAESILNWKYEMGKDGSYLSLLVLEETYAEEGNDEFEHDRKTQYRVLRVKDNVYTQEIYRESDGKLTSFATYTPRVVGRTLDYIPFTFVNPLDDSGDYHNPPLLSVVNVNLSHYRSSADLKNGLHFCGLPIPYAAGFDIEGDTFHVGSENGYVSSKENAKIGFGELTGKSLTYIKEDMDADEQRMAALGARLLENSRKGIEKPEAIRLRQVGEHNSLRQIANSVSVAMTKILGWWSEWNKKNFGTITYQLNTDFVSDKLSPAEIKEYVYAWQSGAWSKETMFFNMKAGECYPEEHTFELEEQMILDDMGAPPAKEGEE